MGYDSRGAGERLVELRNCGFGEIWSVKNVSPDATEINKKHLEEQIWQQIISQLSMRAMWNFKEKNIE